jgi:hypothetical protein
MCDGFVSIVTVSRPETGTASNHGRSFLRLASYSLKVTAHGRHTEAATQRVYHYRKASAIFNRRYDS